jgi:sirohydrochlorin ferrochelatase
MKGILILAHGSREKETENTFHKIFDMVKDRFPNMPIEMAYMQFCDATIEKGLDKLIEKGATEIKIVPYFLFDGVHIREDIPAAIKNYLGKRQEIKVTLAGTLGADERLADILADRINEVL